MAAFDSKQSELSLLEMTVRMSKLAFQRAFEEMGLELTIDQWHLLSIVAENPGCSQRELATKSGKDPASITRMLDILEGRKLVLRQDTPQNRRQVQLQLGPRGEALLKAHGGLLASLNEKAFKGFSKGERESLQGLLLRLQENLADI